MISLDPLESVVTDSYRASQEKLEGRSVRRRKNPRCAANRNKIVVFPVGALCCHLLIDDLCQMWPHNRPLQGGRHDVHDRILVLTSVLVAGHP
jgi:hypothetical protein